MTCSIPELARIAVFVERPMNADERNALYGALGDRSKFAKGDMYVEFPKHAYHGTTALLDLLSPEDRVAAKLLLGE